MAEETDATDTLRGELLSPPPPHAARLIDSASARHIVAQLVIGFLARPFMTISPELGHVSSGTPAARDDPRFTAL
jgi:hypothetical protein